MKLTTPVSLQAEHKELYDELTKVIASEGKTGQFAKTVADVLHPL